MYTETTFTPFPFGNITQLTHDEHRKLYAGYVKNANGASQTLGELWMQDPEKNQYVMSELARRFSFEFNGIRNHEIYFKLLEGGASPLATDSALMKAIEASYGSFETWMSIFKSMAMIRGIGWAMLWYDRKAGRLINSWVDEQHLGQLQDCAPIVALDMWEHSYVANYQPSGKKQYVEDFIHALNWSVAEANFAAAQ